MGGSLGWRMESLCLGGPEVVGFSEKGNPTLSVPKLCVPKTLAFAFGLRLRSKTRCFKTRVLGRGYLMEGPKGGCDLGPCVVKR